MTVWYQDPIEGNDSYSGDSWALTLSGTDGQTYGTTKFTSATGGLTGTEGRYIRISGTIKKIVAVVSDTEVTLDSTFSSGSSRPFYIGGAVASGMSLPYATYFAAGDEIRVPKTANSEAVSAGSLTWAVDNTSVGIASGRVKEIDQCESGWAGGTGVTVTHYSTGKYQGSYAANLTVGSSYAGGKMAYKQIGGGSSVDFSAFQGISFLLSMRGSTAVDAADGMRICLCSDTAGDTIVDDLTLPWPASLSGGTQPMVVFAAGNLGSSIQSVAVYCTNDPGTPTFDIDNIMAVKSIADADHLCHRCLISQGSTLYGGSNTWWGINCFESETSITLPGKFQGDTEGAISSHRREAVTVLDVAWYPGSSGKCGTRTAPIVVSGGWNKASGLKDGATIWYCWYGSSLDMYVYAPWVTWKDFTLGIAAGSIGISAAFIDGQMLENVNFVAMCGGMSATGMSDPCSSSTTEGRSLYGWSFKNVYFTGIYSYGMKFEPNFYQYRQTIRDFHFDNVKYYSTRGPLFQGMVGSRFVDLDVRGGAYSSSPCGLSFYHTNWDLEFNRLTLKNVADYGLSAHCLLDTRIHNLLTAGNGTAALYIRSGEIVLFNASIAEATEFVTLVGGARIHSIKHDQAADTHRLWRYGGSMSDEPSVRHTASGIAWKIQPTADGEAYRVKVAELAVAAGSYTVGIWLRRDNTEVAGKFYTPGGQVAGVADEISDSISANANIWEQQSLVITPSESGALEFWVEAVGGTACTLYIDDFSVA